jgi:Domain of unknown function (DUF4167)
MQNGIKGRREDGRRTGKTTRIGMRQNGSFGNAHRNYERYLALAREASQNGDVIEAENWYQHAEHYFRVMREGTN